MANFFATLDADTRVEFIQILKELKDLNKQSINILKEMSQQFQTRSSVTDGVTESHRILSTPIGVAEDEVDLPSVFHEEDGDLIIPSHFPEEATPTLVDDFSNFNKEENSDLNDSYEKPLNKFHCVDDFHLHLDLTHPFFDRGKCDVLSSNSSEKSFTPLIPRFGYESDLGFIHSNGFLCGNDANIFGEGNLFVIMSVSLASNLTDGDVCFYLYFAYNCSLFDPGGYAVESSNSFGKLIFQVILNLGYASDLRVLDSIVLCAYDVRFHDEGMLFVKKTKRSEALLLMWVGAIEIATTQKLLVIMPDGVGWSSNTAEYKFLQGQNGAYNTPRIISGTWLVVTTDDENVWQDLTTNNRVQLQVVHCEQLDKCQCLNIWLMSVLVIAKVQQLCGKILLVENVCLQHKFTKDHLLLNVNTSYLCLHLTGKVFNPGEDLNLIKKTVLTPLWMQAVGTGMGNEWFDQLLISGERAYILLLLRYGLPGATLVLYFGPLLSIETGRVIMGCCRLLFVRGNMLQYVFQNLHSKSYSSACSRVFWNLVDHIDTNDYGGTTRVARGAARRENTSWITLSITSFLCRDASRYKQFAAMLIRWHFWYSSTRKGEISFLYFGRLCIGFAPLHRETYIPAIVLATLELQILNSTRNIILAKFWGAANVDQPIFISANGDALSDYVLVQIHVQLNDTDHRAYVKSWWICEGQWVFSNHFAFSPTPTENSLRQMFISPTVCGLWHPRVLQMTESKAINCTRSTSSGWAEDATCARIVNKVRTEMVQILIIAKPDHGNRYTNGEVLLISLDGVSYCLMLLLPSSTAVTGQFYISSINKLGSSYQPKIRRSTLFLIGSDNVQPRASLFHLLQPPDVVSFCFERLLREAYISVKLLHFKRCLHHPPCCAHYLHSSGTQLDDANTVSMKGENEGNITGVKFQVVRTKMWTSTCKLNSLIISETRTATRYRHFSCPDQDKGELIIGPVFKVCKSFTGPGDTLLKSLTREITSIWTNCLRCFLLELFLNSILEDKDVLRRGVLSCTYYWGECPYPVPCQPLAIVLFIYLIISLVGQDLATCNNYSHRILGHYLLVINVKRVCKGEAKK